MTENRSKCNKSSLLPPRPKKPLTGYNLFLSQHMLNNRNDFRFNPTGLFQDAACKWNCLPDEYKQCFKESASKNLKHRKSWNLKRKLLKRVPNQFILYHSDLARNAKVSFCEMQCQTKKDAENWKNLNPKSKEIYKFMHCRIKKEKDQLIKRICKKEITFDAAIEKYYGFKPIDEDEQNMSQSTSPCTDGGDPDSPVPGSTDGAQAGNGGSNC